MTEIRPAEAWSEVDEEADYMQAVRRESAPALLSAIGRYAGMANSSKPLPAWLAEAIRSEWGASVFVDLLIRAGAVFEQPEAGRSGATGRGH